MSFASQVREEIARAGIQKECCARAACYGIACFAKYFDARGLVLQTELESTARYAAQCFGRFAVQGELVQKARSGGVLYEYAVREPQAVQRMHALFGTTGAETSLKIDPALLVCSGCLRAYLGAAFLCGGTVTDPQKEYNIEFITPRTNLSRDFEALLAEHEFAPRRTRRKGVNLVYIKASAHVAALLAFMGAPQAAGQLEKQKKRKHVNNQANRQTNCDMANLKKAARANAESLKAIRYLEQQGALKALPEPLRAAACARLQHPDLSLAALCACFDPPLSKSGLAHRIKKLEAAAQALSRRTQEETHE